MVTRPTIEELNAISRNNGKGASRSRLASWGVPWPPPNGWLKALMHQVLEQKASNLLNDPIPMTKKQARKQVLAARQARRAQRKIRRRQEMEAVIRKPKFEPVRSRAEKDEFYLTWEWKKLRMQTFERDGRRCVCCGATPEDGVRLVVDHIKPLGEFWSLRLDLNNTQVLCNDCNMGKGNWLHKDFRSHEEGWTEETDSLMAEFRAIMKE